MRKLLKYLTHYKKETVLAPLFKMLEAGFELFVPLVMASIIDRGIPAGDSLHIWGMGGILLLLGIIGLICSVTAQFYAAKAAVGFGSELRRDLFSHINNLTYSEMDIVGTSTFLTRITSDTNQVQTGVNMVLRLFLRSPFIVAGAMVMAFTIDVGSAMIFVVAIPLLSLVVFGIMYLTMPWYRKAQMKLDGVLLRVRENLAGVRVIRAFNRQDSETEAFREESGGLTTIQLLVGRISALLNPLTYIIVNGAIILLIYTGGWKVESGVLTQGEVVALVNYMSQILVELIKLANLIITMSKSAACANRIAEIFAVSPGMQEGTFVQWKTDTDSPAVIMEDITFYYPEAREPSLEHISFRAGRGETIGIIGGTGSGKSTLVNLLPRFYDVSSGQLRLFGRDVKEYTYSALRERIGMVPQKAILFSGTVADNLRWGNRNASEEDMWRALTTAQAADFVRAKEGGLEAQITQGGKNLSGGQRQRLSIARALMVKPDILVLDDSSSALDFATDAALRSAIRNMDGNTTVFLVSQRASSIKHADRILVLDDGKMAGWGTHPELLQSCAVYREICSSQFSVSEMERELGRKGN